MDRLSAVFVIATMTVLLASGGAAAQSNEKPFTHTIKPRALGEECFKLPGGQSIGYAFESSAAVDFNIHFHRGNDVVYPVASDAVRSASDRFTAPSTEEFCLMWTNRTLDMVTVKGRLAP